MRALISDHGAKPDGSSLCTDAFAAAIAAVSAAGGGTVVVPPGRWLTGMIRLRSRIELHLMRGATVIAAPRPEDHLPLIASAGGAGDYWHHGEGSFHLVVAQDCEQVAISGSGRLDGNGPVWYDDAEGSLAWPLAKAKDWRRMGALVLISNCREVSLSEVTLGNVGNWTLHLHESDRLRVQGITIDNPADAPNADGIDITGCRGVSISDCHIDTCDDAICLKTMPQGRSCEDVAVSNCVLRTACAALKLGANESFQDMRNVVMSNCTVRGSHRAIGLYSFNGAICENISIDNVVCDTRAPLMFTRPIHFDLRHKDRSRPAGAIRNVRINGLLATSNGRCLLSASPGLMLEDILLRDIIIRFPCIDDPAPCAAAVGGGQFSADTPWARQERAALVVENARNLQVENFCPRWPISADIPADWTFARKAANGSQRWFEPADWQLAGDVPFAAVSARNVQDGHLDTRNLSGYQGAEALRTQDCHWLLGS